MGTGMEGRRMTGEGTSLQGRSEHAVWKCMWKRAAAMMAALR